MMSGVLLVILGFALALTWITLSSSVVAVARERLTRGAAQLAAQGDSGGRTAKARLLRQAEHAAFAKALSISRSDPAMESFLGRAALEEVRAALVSMGASDTGATMELWSDDGRRVAIVGRDLRPSTTVELSETDSRFVPRHGLEGLVPSDSAQIGPLHESGGTVGFVFVAPVRESGRRVGWLVRQPRLREGTTDEVLDALVGRGTHAYWRSGDFWSTLEGVVVPPPLERRGDDSAMTVVRAGAGEMLAVERRISGTPLILVLEQPVSEVLAPARRAISKLAAMSVLPLLAGLVAAWLISRRLSRPIVALTGAAERMAAGDFDARVRPSGVREMAALARGFNRMAQHVGRSRRDLERTVAELEVARHQAETASRAKSDFLAVMSHELRTPLNAIGGYVELMELGIRGPVTETQLRDLERIRASQEHLLGLIGGVLDLSRIESGSVVYDLVAIEVERFITALDALVRPQVTAKQLKLEYAPIDPELAVFADREKLRQILLNLLSNAIRYTPADGSVRLSSWAVDEHVVAIAVEDTGIGIPEHALAHVFEPFVQLDRSLTRHREGVGLGLAISRDLARGMGGDLTAQSVVGAGSRFVITLRRTEPDEQSAMLTSGEARARG